MQIASLLFLLALIVFVAWFIGQPFASRRAQRAVSAGHEASSLLAERDRVLEALQELDFDHIMGKIPLDEYPVQRAALLQKGATILQQLDNLAAAAPAAVRLKKGLSAEDAIEAAIAARRDGPTSSAKIALSDDDLETLIAARRSNRKGRSGGFCSKCGKPVLASDRFCPACGQAIK